MKQHAARRRTRSLAAAGALVLLGALTACGDDGGDAADPESAPQSASKEEFCDAFGNVFTGIMEAGDDEQAQIAAVKDAVDELAEVGTPEDMPEDARKGFEIFVGLFDDVDEDTTAEELDQLGNDLSEEENAAGEAFTTWAMEECPDAFGDLTPSEGTEMPEELESDLAEPESTESTE